MELTILKLREALQPVPETDSDCCHSSMILEAKEVGMTTKIAQKADAELAMGQYLEQLQESVQPERPESHSAGQVLIAWPYGGFDRYERRLLVVAVADSADPEWRSRTVSDTRVHWCKSWHGSSRDRQSACRWSMTSDLCLDTLSCAPGTP
jgi:hypothetical protein